MGETHDKSDAQFLGAYPERGTEAAFAKIVARHTDLVYSAGLRQVYSPDLARDVAQSIFTDLARKARTASANLSPEASLVSRLYCGTKFAARDLNRSETRRIQRERQAMDLPRQHVHQPAGVCCLCLAGPGQTAEVVIHGGPNPWLQPYGHKR